jgi:hypothetical protein
MDNSQANSEAYIKGYKDGWRSVPRSGPPPQIPGFVSPHFLLEGKSPYESGYQRGRAAAGGSDHA